MPSAVCGKGHDHGQEKNMRHWILLAAFGATTVPLAALTGCVPAVMTPTVTATPGPGKLPADVASDHAACAAQTNQQMASAVQAANNQVTGTALQNVLTGTGANAVDVNTQATSALQQQYDTAYSACMYARGDNIPPYYMQPTYYAEPTETTPTQHVKRRVAQKPSSPTPTPTPTASGSGQASGSGFVVPAPTSAPVAGSGFVQPAPVQPASASGGFAVPPPASH
jgi:hypothetical protein